MCSFAMEALSLWKQTKASSGKITKADNVACEKLFFLADKISTTVRAAIKLRAAYCACYLTIEAKQKL